MRGIRQILEWEMSSWNSWLFLNGMRNFFKKWFGIRNYPAANIILSFVVWSDRTTLIKEMWKYIFFFNVPLALWQSLSIIFYKKMTMQADDGNTITHPQSLVIIWNNPPGTGTTLKKGRDVDNLISTLLWRCFTNVGSTAANGRRINVHLWLVIRRKLVKYSQRCFNVDSTLNYGWRDWQPNLNVVSTSKE
jgi:hypothetical protein